MSQRWDWVFITPEGTCVFLVTQGRCAFLCGMGGVANRCFSIGDKFGCQKGGTGFLSLPNVHVFSCHPGEMNFFRGMADVVSRRLKGIGICRDITYGAVGVISLLRHCTCVHAYARPSRGSKCNGVFPGHVATRARGAELHNVGG